MSAVDSTELIDSSISVSQASVAIVHEWFTTIAGSERVVEQMCGLYPDAVLHALCVDPQTVSQTRWLRDREIRTSLIQRLPGARTRYRSYLPAMPLAVEQFDLSQFDVVLSSSHAVAKGVLTGPDQLHISYVHSPIRYAWDLQHQYLREAGLDRGAKGLLAKYLLHRLRIWDTRTAHGVDHFIANSQFVARRIRKVYGRHADVIYPPVDVEAFYDVGNAKGDYFLTASRMVPYKRIDLIVEAFATLPAKRLVVVGDGPEMAKIKQKAGRNVELLGYQSFDALRTLMQGARAFVFAAEEDFGIVSVEAQACGTPVIAFGRGGSLETVIGSGESPTGVFFESQSVDALRSAVLRFDANRELFQPEACRLQAERFSVPKFNRELASFVQSRYASHRRNTSAARCDGVLDLPNVRQADL